MLPALAGDHAALGVDSVCAFFQKGIAPKPAPKTSKGTKAKPKRSRVYTVAELNAKFGEPDNRGNVSVGEGIHECWTYRCRDGVVGVNFLEVGVSENGGKNSLRLEIVNFNSVRGKIASKYGFFLLYGGTPKLAFTPEGKRKLREPAKRDRESAKAAAGKE